MNDRIYIKPCPGMSIPMPDNSDPIGAEGALVPNTSFYRRFILRGEAEKSRPPKLSGKSTKTKE
ncbi:DUF2635 domain-containing protein [Thalassospira sp. MCCC 1A01428]|uniref:DUF2635 domain-containing protein n=1 Tax=Thalassospira sp. MCCC 1A01428 TaxID=1470575 RepID=UPI000A1E06D5|nr:DUF2635 domain-containing protein [Thalassospira sp. MCCC 1A01428]OSQ41669.1 hypothetical protein THS27_18335 [Thalassospira sp. MCCC 1A01428]